MRGGVCYTMPMKANRITLIAQAIGMYLMHIPLYILFIVELIPGEHEALFYGLLRAMFILLVPVAAICVANIVLSVISIFKGNTDPSKTVMKVKLALIPWYALNFILCVIVVALFFNPFTMLGIPVVIALALGLTCFFMLGTSLPDVAYCLRNVYVEKKETLTRSRVITVLCLFVFCLDVFAGVSFYRQNKKTVLPPTDNGEVAVSE